MTVQKTRWFAFLLLAALLLTPLRPAHADLTITPMRVVFGPRDRSAQVQLLNMSDRSNTYRFKWLQMKMGPGGRYELMPADNKNPFGVSQMVIFTPRQVTIAPHGQQTVRLMLRRPANLPHGEYRAHLAMIRLARMGPERQDPHAKGIQMELKVNLGFSIPVIVRSGTDPDLKVSLNNPTLALNHDRKPRPELKIDLIRVAGTFSSYGRIIVDWSKPGEVGKQIGSLDNVALYPEMKIRHLAIPLTEAPSGGTLHVSYVGKYESEGTTWDDKTFPIGK